jgi:hypothetical protein
MTTYRYAAVERALIHVLEVPPERVSSFHAEIKNLSKYGVPFSRRPERRGHQIGYSYEDVCMLMVTLVLCSWRSRPQDMSAAVLRHWRTLVEGIRRHHAGEYIMLVAHPNFFGARFNGEDPMPMQCMGLAELHPIWIESVATDRWHEFVWLSAYLNRLEEGLTRLRARKKATPEGVAQVP